jgi:hypothetical protein
VTTAKSKGQTWDELLKRPPPSAWEREQGAKMSCAVIRVNPTASLTHQGKTVHGIFAMTRGQLLRALVTAELNNATATIARLERRLNEQRAYYDLMERTYA